MTSPHPRPSLEELFDELGEVGAHLAAMEAAEGAAGNLSLYLGWPVDPRPWFPVEELVELPQPVPELAGSAFLVTGSGRRLRELGRAPLRNLGCLVVEPGGALGRLFTAPGRLFRRLTSEFNTHLAAHHDYVTRTGASFLALVHAQPLHLTFLSHVPAYQDAAQLTRRLLRWQPEAIMQFPEGVGVVPFKVPGSAELAAAATAELRRHRLVVWAKHGVMARSDDSLGHACDCVEYLEAAARYELLNLAHGAPAPGLSDDELRAIARAYGIPQTLY
ncbi:MAG TPA: class II aldolase/adducin family protein [Chloroflexaceae bacterium]|nr:class II aldolase/adducin family protein [Chloroflexaceae bacterium]